MKKNLLKITWLSMGQAAKLKKISPQLLYHYVITGRGPSHEKRGRYYFFPKDKMEMWEKPKPKTRGPKPYV